MFIIEKKVTLDELKKMSEKMYDSLVKAVVDTEKNIIAIDADMHADEEALLLEHGSQQENLWGINIYPYNAENNWIEFDSIINIRPARGNRSRGVDDSETQSKIKTIVSSWVIK